MAICFSMLSSWVVFSCCLLCLSSSCFCCLDNCVCHAPSSAAVRSSLSSLSCAGDSARFFTFFFFGERGAELSTISVLAVSVLVSLSVMPRVAGLGDYKHLPHTKQPLLVTCWGLVVRCLTFFLSFVVSVDTKLDVSKIIGVGVCPPVGDG